MKMTPLDYKLLKKLLTHLDTKKARKEIQKANQESYKMYGYINQIYRK